MSRKLLILCIYSMVSSGFGTPISKVIIWGYKLHSHTHSYIHYGFFKAFKFLGYNVYWLDDNDDLSKIDLAHSLFISTGGVDQKIPLRQDSFYILHNCLMDRYIRVVDPKHCIKLVVYLDSCRYRSDLQQVEEYVFYDFNDRAVHMPWATDLLPEEIDENKRAIKLPINNKNIVFIGTVAGDTIYGNSVEVNQFKNACHQAGFSFLSRGGYGNGTGLIGIDQNIELIKSAYLAPAIQGRMQCDFGYIPCRIFKNISYGKFGITNSKAVYNLFHKKIVYNSDPYQLCFDAIRKASTITNDEIIEQMNFVRDNHTYINRISSIMEFISRLNAV